METHGENEEETKRDIHNGGSVPRAKVKRWRQSRLNVWEVRRVERERGGNTVSIAIHEK
jgi:hypothetical protein